MDRYKDGDVIILDDSCSTPNGERGMMAACSCIAVWRSRAVFQTRGVAVVVMVTCVVPPLALQAC
jgi:hypothetical protein